MLDTVKTLLTQGFNQLGDIRKTITLRQFVSQNYNTSNAENTITYNDVNLQAHVCSFTRKEVDNKKILADDIKCVLLNIASSTNDKVIIAGETYNVISKRTDPTLTLLTLQLRK